MSTFPRFRPPPVAVLTMLLVLAGGGCDTASTGTGTAAGPRATAEDGRRVPLGDRHGACLRVLPGEELSAARADGDGDTAVLRHAGGGIDVYAGPRPDFPGFRRVTRGLADTPTPGFVAIAEAREGGRTWLLSGHKRDAASPRTYVMLSGADAMFVRGLDASRIQAC